MMKKMEFSKLKINLKVSYYILIIVLIGVIWFDMYGDSVGTTFLTSAYPDKPITLLSPYAAGSDYDLDLNILIPYVEKELGVPIKVVNKPGNGGWDAWMDLFEGDNDGYTIGYISTPALLTGYLNPSNDIDYTYRDLELIANHELNVIGIAVNKDDERFSTIEELIDYARNNEVTTTSQSIGDANHVAVLRLNQKYITNFIPIHMGGDIQGYDAVRNHTVDVLFDNVGVLSAAEQRGEIKVLAVLSDIRSDFLPDVWTMYESGFGTINASTNTGFAAPKNLEEKQLTILKKAFDKGINNKEYIEKMQKKGSEIRYISDFEYWELLYEEEMIIKQIINIIYFLSR